MKVRIRKRLMTKEAEDRVIYRVMSQGMKLASRRWKRQGKIFPFRASRRNTALQALSPQPSTL